MSEESKLVSLSFIDMTNIVEVREALGESGVASFLSSCSKSLEAIRKAHGGTLVRSVGSTMLFAFDRVEDAVGASCEIERVSEWWASDLPPPLFRIGIHCGAVVFRNGSMIGDAVSTSARLVTSARPGQILCSAAAAEQLSAVSEFELREHVSDQFVAQKFEAPLYEVVWQGQGLQGTSRLAAPAEGDAAGGHPPPLDTVKTRTASLVVDDQRPRKIRLTQEHRKQPAAAQTAGDAAGKVAAESAEPARLYLIWERQQAVVDVDCPVVTIGRLGSNDICLEVDTASRQHAHIEWRGGTFFLVDHSWNGTYLYDDKGIETLAHNTEVQLSGEGLICPGCPETAPGAMPIHFVEGG